MPVQAARRVKRASTEWDEHVAAPGLLGRVMARLRGAIGRRVNLSVPRAHSSAQNETARAGVYLFFESRWAGGLCPKSPRKGSLNLRASPSAEHTSDPCGVRRAPCLCREDFRA
jgi:hypothetical protein